MKRTQIYISEREASALSSIGAITKKSVSELIRGAIDQLYINDRTVHFDQIVREVGGIWKKRKDNGGAYEYVRGLRSDRRSQAAK
ncbi:CopG family transcriptional regulator [Candidatus Desantisbacteria bacterium CG_4_10_14_0_8_um_filter_48_22]|uniref:CopG family transcriptional regulator n=1 Tax=Candidatus Desantisbacteria bacterium CG_4_10_14_0_8_um_filter_48_22 TaxID=1974543 RepID=A0A2M7SDN6_9BACT|nr:MAG: hypothetical protein AUJ67_08475 [Candidatus Desantisbacteria bacterium CG1_02_49_89]PIV56204.1 MAG: CopG family transcriptional regulator [Candidatus Desantisbacteria bacterium CG02_land_8_20_14_3_00_49_13]PIZ17646.1 MAG: CopG family transcriptional regulator [Candidatus Desantisbacteria bacterium CG_4_10_14_0_8_um_filter_48_22]